MANGGLTSNKNFRLAAMGLGVLAVGSFMWSIHMFDGIGLKGPASSVVGGAGISAQSVAVGAACPSTGGTAVQFASNYVDVTNANTITGANTTVSIYQSGMQNPLTAGTTAASGAYNSVGTVNCGQTGLLGYVGDAGTTYYTAKVTFDAQNAMNTNVPTIALKKSGAATLSFSNTSTFGVASVDQSVTAGTPNSDVTMKIKAGSFYYGDGGQELCARWDMTNVSKVTFTTGGVLLTEISADPTVASAANLQTKCYELTGDMSNAMSKDVQVNVYPKSGVTPANSSIDIYLNDKASYIKNGELIMGYWNADTSADLGLAKVSKTSAIVLNP